MSDEELLYQPMSEALVSEKFAKELSKEIEKRNLFPNKGQYDMKQRTDDP